MIVVPPTRPAGYPDAGDSAGPVDTLACSQCGSPLPPASRPMDILDKLTQLAQFGMVPEGEPAPDPAAPRQGSPPLRNVR